MEAVNGDTDKDTVALKSEDNETECCVLTDHVSEMQVSESERLRSDKFQADDENSNICPRFQLLILCWCELTDFNSCCPR